MIITQDLKDLPPMTSGICLTALDMTITATRLSIEHKVGNFSDGASYLSKLGVRMTKACSDLSKTVSEEKRAS